MEISELSSSAEDKCLGHDGTLNMLQSLRKILAERKVKDDEEISTNTITVSVGPQFEGDISRIYVNKVVIKRSFLFLK